jgi:hypothetical protein
MKEVFAITLLIIGATAAHADRLIGTNSNSSAHRFRASGDITPCLSTAISDFDAYRDAKGVIEMFGTQTDIFYFRKCLTEKGVSLAPDR